MVLHSTMTVESDSPQPLHSRTQFVDNDFTIPSPRKRSRYNDNKKDERLSNTTERSISFSMKDICCSELSKNVAVTESIYCITRHTIKSILRYLRVALPENNVGIRDISSSFIKEKPISELQDLRQVPCSHALTHLERFRWSQSKQSSNMFTEMNQLGYRYFYKRVCSIHLSPEGNSISSLMEVDDVGGEWVKDISALGHFSFHYASTKEIDSDTSVNKILGDGDIDQNFFLYQFVAEYRSSSTLQEGTCENILSLENELMTSLEDIFGLSHFNSSLQDPGTKGDKGLYGATREERSIARDLKIGAIFALNDEQSPFNMKFESGVTGNRYYFHRPHKGKSNTDGNRDEIISLRTMKNTKNTSEGISRIYLTVEDFSKLTRSNSLSTKKTYIDNQNEHHDYRIMKHQQQHMCLLEKFRLFSTFHNEIQPRNDIAQGNPSRHHLLLDPNQAGKVYVDGELILDWNNKENLSKFAHPALFGFDLIGIQTTAEGLIRTKISDLNELKSHYCALLREILTDASQGQKQVAQLMLDRLINGICNVHKDISKCVCLESELMSDAKYDPVGVAAKALHTQFTRKYGKNAYPCREEEIVYAQDHIGHHRRPIVPVPQQAIDVFRRGGFFGLVEMEKWNWFTSYPKEDLVYFSDLKEQTLKRDTIERAVKSLQIVEKKTSGGYSLIENEHIAIVRNKILTNFSPRQSTPDLTHMCRYNEDEGIYYVNDEIFDMELPSTDETKNNSGPLQVQDDETLISYRSYFLGYCIAQSHKNPNVLFQFLAQEACKK